MVFSHGWPLSADAFEDQMFFLASKCYALCCTSPEVIRGLEAFLEKRRARKPGEA